MFLYRNLHQLDNGAISSFHGQHSYPTVCNISGQFVNLVLHILSFIKTYHLSKVF